MPSTYSPNLRIELIASGEQGNTWGGTTNNNLGTLIENAISGTVSIDSMPSNTYTLTVLNGANDNARNMYIKVSSSTTLTAAGTIIAPAVSKMYVITNSSLGGFALTLKTASSTGISIPNGATRTVFFDGTDFVDTVTATKSLLLDGNATQNLQAVTKQQMDAALALKLSLVGGTGNTMGGPLYLQNTSDPGADQCAIPRGYATTTFLPKTNPTVTGTLTLSSTDPVGYQATSKNYNDSFYVAKTGSTMTGALTLYPTLPTTAWQAVPKQYVDNISVAYGSGISITGTIAANNVTVNLLYATTSTIGGVKVDGTSITINGSGVISAATGGGGTVTGVSVATSNGFYGSSSGGATPQLTLSTTVNGILKSTGSVGSPAGISAATGAEIAAAIGSATVTNATNASSANSAPWSGLTGAAPSNSIFSNGAGYITSGSLSSYVAKSGSTMTGTLNISQSATQLAFAAFGNNLNWIASATGSSVSDTSFIALTLNDIGSTGTFRGVLSSGHTGSAADWPLVFSVGSALQVVIATSGNMYPYTSNAISCGTSSNQWSAIWATTGVVNSSDATQKTDITDTDLGLDFITALRPVSYKWKVGQNIVQVPDNLTEASDGCKDHPVVARPGVRTHYGLIAQEVKAVLGDKDFGGYIDAGFSDGVEGEKGLRYDQFISPLIKSIQELNAKVEALTAEVNTLKGA